jgi:hypothetical protein
MFESQHQTLFLILSHFTFIKFPKVGLRIHGHPAVNSPQIIEIFRQKLF